jgi:hypothetical protein
MSVNAQKKKAAKHQKQDDESVEGADDTSLEEQKEGESDASLNVKQAPKKPSNQKQAAAIAEKKKGKELK